jgi:WD40 repeat protein
MNEHGLEHDMKRGLVRACLALVLTGCGAPSAPPGPIEVVAPAPASSAIAPAPSREEPAVAVLDARQLWRITDVVFSPDGQLLAVAAGQPEVRVFEAKTGRLVALLAKPGENILRLAWSPDGDRLAGAAEHLVVWNLAKSDQVERVVDMKSGGGSQVKTLAWSKTGVIAAGYVRKILRVSSETWAPLSTIENKGWVAGLSFSPDGTELACADEDGILTVFDTADAPRFTLKKLPGAIPYWDVRWSPDGSTLAVGTVGFMEIVDAKTGARRGTLPGGIREHGAFDPKGTKIASMSGDQLELFDVATLQQVGGKPAFDHRGRMALQEVVDWSPTGDRIAAGGELGLVILRAADLSVVARPMSGDPSWGFSRPSLVALGGGSGQRIVAMDRDVTLWDVGTGALSGVLTPDERDAACSYDLSSDGRRVAVGTVMGKLHLVDAATGQQLAKVDDDHGTTGCVAFTKEGDAIIATGEDPEGGTLFDADTLAKKPGKAPRCVPRAEISPDKKHFVTLFPERNVFSTKTGRRVAGFGGFGPGFVWGPDGQRFFAAEGDDLRVRTQPEFKSEVFAEMPGVTALGYGSRYVLVAMSSERGRVFHTETRAVLADFPAPLRPAYSVAMTVDANLVVALDLYGVRLTRVLDGKSVHLARVGDGADVGIVLGEDGCVDGPDAALEHVQVRVGEGVRGARMVPLVEADGAARCPGLYAKFVSNEELPKPPAYRGR